MYRSQLDLTVHIVIYNTHRKELTRFYVKRLILFELFRRLSISMNYLLYRRENGRCIGTITPRLLVI